MTLQLLKWFQSFHGSDILFSKTYKRFKSTAVSTNFLELSPQ